MIWGVYFDMIIFSEDNFMVDEENKENLTRDWSIIYLVTLFTWVIGPILGETLSALAPHTQFFSIISLQVLGFSVAMLLHVSKEKTPSLKGKASRTKNIRSSLYELFKNWRILSIHIFGFLLIMFVSKLIESAYWMFGGLYAEDIGIKEGLHWLILGSYTTALILGSVVLGWLNLKKNKETISLFALLGSGVLLFLTNFYTNNLFIFLVITFFSSLFISVVTPLRNSEFTEYLNKLGKLRSSAIGLSCAVGSLSYIVGPTTLGILADYVGYSKMFSSLGFLALVTALVIFISKKKQ
jgi:predicted MFS family arabinose efflux permease